MIIPPQYTKAMLLFDARNKFVLVFWGFFLVFFSISFKKIVSTENLSARA